jgi:UDP-N-acetylmuramoyl-L-alanyl-D-glutamate--2,6-diaminopimelate ligase
MPEARLSRLAAAAGAALVGPDLSISRIAVDSRLVRPGDLFAALPGTRDDGLRHVPDARARGAAAVLAADPLPPAPTIVAADVRRALAACAAELQSHPARELRLVGITGTLGKTSTSLLLESALAAGGIAVGAIGSLGVRSGPPRSAGSLHTSRMTTPDAPALHAALRRLVDAGVQTAVMEVTSHALFQERVAGLGFSAGVFTNLVPDEHLEYHPSPQHYIETKLRFLERLSAGAPLVVDSSNRRVLARAQGNVVPVALDGGNGGAVRLELRERHLNGAVVVLHVRAPLARADGSVLPPGEIPLELLLMGRHQLANAALAAVAALLLGIGRQDVARALADPPRLRRRMEVVWNGRPLVLDDTVGHPRSLRALFEAVRPLTGGGLRIVFGIRGSRGATVNQRLGEALAESLPALTRGRSAHLVVTGSADLTDAANRVRDEERDAVLRVLEARSITFVYEPTLAAAVDRALDGCRPEELVLLLGAQGMDGAADLARARLARAGTDP